MIDVEKPETWIGQGGVMEPLKQADFESRVEKSRMPALVIFTAPECKPCKLMAQDLAELEMNYKDEVAFFRVNATEDMELATRHSVVSTPTLIMFAGGKPVLRILGYVTKTDIQKQVDDTLEKYTN